MIVNFCQTLITDITFVICSFFKTQRTCLLNTIAVSPCQAGNTTCTCENAEITAVTQACVLESCSVKHQLSMYPSLSNTTPFSALETGSNRNKSGVLVPNCRENSNQKRHGNNLSTSHSRQTWTWIEKYYCGISHCDSRVGITNGFENSFSLCGE